MTDPVVKPLEFELMFRRLPEARAAAPETPYGFHPIHGDFPTVAREANRLNATQANSGLRDFFFFPETTPAQWDRNHCDVCRKAAIADALED